MPTVFAHVYVGSSLGVLVPPKVLPRRYLFLGSALAACPDLDTIGLFLGIPYASLLGHRGLSHSLPFALLFAWMVTIFVRRRRNEPPGFRILFSYLFLCIASHGILDAFTNGGHGIGFWSPFSNHRYFFPVTPIQVSPISPSKFFSQWGVLALWSEFKFIVLPTTVIVLCAKLAQRLQNRFQTGHKNP